MWVEMPPRPKGANKNYYFALSIQFTHERNVAAITRELDALDEDDRDEVMEYLDHFRQEGFPEC